MSLFQLTILEHLQVFLTIVTSVPSPSSPCISCMYLQIISQIYPMVQLSIQLLSLSSQTHNSNPLPNFLFSSSHHKGTQSSLTLNCILVHTPGTQRLPRSPFYCSLQTLPCPFSWTWAYFCLIYSNSLWPTQYSHIIQSAKEHGWFVGAIAPISQTSGF